MDYNDPSRRQYVQNPYGSPQSRQQQQQQQPQHGTPPPTSSYTTPSFVERYQQPPYLQQHLTAVPSTTRTGSDQVYGFASSPRYGSGSSTAAQTMHYPGDTQSHEGSRRQDTQPYGQYGTGLMYGMAHQTHSATQSPYDSVSRYTQRPDSTSETLASPFGGAQTAQYYLAGQAVPTSATMPGLLAPHGPPPQYPTAYVDAGPSSQTFGGAMIDSAQSGIYPAYSPQYAQPSQSVSQRFSNYQTQIRTIFSYVREGSLRNVSDLLVDASVYLLGNVEALGLTKDDDNLHDERIRMWDEFNRAWLVTLQAQLDMTQDPLQAQHLREPRSVMTAEVLDTIARELIRLCDDIEKHGLVDYQMGVAEEEILDLMLRCLAQLDPEPAPAADAGAESHSSAVR